MANTTGNGQHQTEIEAPRSATHVLTTDMPVWIRLNRIGRGRLRQQRHQQLRQELDLREDAEGWSRWSLRDLMTLMGSEAPLLMHAAIRVTKPSPDRT